MAFQIPSEYYRLLLKPMLKRFNEEPTAYELAFACIIMTSHFNDVYAAALGMTDLDKSKIQLEGIIPDFRAIVAIADAAKHQRIDRKKHGSYKGLAAADAEIGSGAAFDDGSTYDDGTGHDDADDTVVITMPEGELFDIRFLCNTAIETIRTKLI